MHPIDIAKRLGANRALSGELLDGVGLTLVKQSDLDMAVDALLSPSTSDANMLGRIDRAVAAALGERASYFEGTTGHFDRQDAARSYRQSIRQVQEAIRTVLLEDTRSTTIEFAFDYLVDGTTHAETIPLRIPIVDAPPIAFEMFGSRWFVIDDRPYYGEPHSMHDPLASPFCRNGEVEWSRRNSPEREAAIAAAHVRSSEYFTDGKYLFIPSGGPLIMLDLPSPVARGGTPYRIAIIEPSHHRPASDDDFVITPKDLAAIQGFLDDHGWSNLRPDRFDRPDLFPDSRSEINLRTTAARLFGHPYERRLASKFTPALLDAVARYRAEDEAKLPLDRIAELVGIAVENQPAKMTDTPGKALRKLLLEAQLSLIAWRAATS